VGFIESIETVSVRQTSNSRPVVCVIEGADR
jgi:hypothetical protein